MTSEQNWFWSRLGKSSGVTTVSYPETSRAAGSENSHGQGGQEPEFPPIPCYASVWKLPLLPPSAWCLCLNRSVAQGVQVWKLKRRQPSEPRNTLPGWCRWPDHFNQLPELPVQKGKGKIWSKSGHIMRESWKNLLMDQHRVHKEGSRLTLRFSTRAKKRAVIQQMGKTVRNGFWGNSWPC